MKRTLLILLGALLLVWGGMFATDLVRCGNLQRPLFVVGIPDTLYDDGGSGTYQGLGYKVKVQGQLTVEYGYVPESVEMSVLGKVVSASIR